MAISEAPQCTIGQLCDVIDMFINANKHNRDNSMRWFADHLDETLMTARRIRGGGLLDTDRKLIASFRLGEIQKEKDSKRTEIERLEREEQKIAQQI